MYHHHRPPAQLSRHGSAPAGCLLSALADFPAFPPLAPEDDSSSAAESPDYHCPAPYTLLACPDVIAGSTSLLRQSSSPAGSLSRDALLDAVTSGYHGTGRAKSQLDSLSSISEMSSTGEMEEALIANDPYNMASWDNSHSFTFSTSSGSGISNNINHGEAMLQCNLPEAQMEMEEMEKLLQLQQDAVPCKVRAKRGFATHPRSIAERVRRTKISEKLRRLQEIVPNMDKQTNTADMLDLAVEHIRVLQEQIQALQEECHSCTCTSIPDI